MQSDQLPELIRRHASRSRENLQVADRLRDLLPQVLRQSKRNLHHRFKGAEAERHALNDPDYLQKIEDYLELYRDGLEARIQFETHRMLMQAWQTLNALSRVEQERKIHESMTKSKPT